MAKKSYIGVDSIARKIKKWYVGVDGKARKVKKAYIGVGNIAKLIFTSEIKSIQYLKTLTPSTSTSNVPSGASSGTNSKGMIVGGGQYYNGNYVVSSTTHGYNNSTLTYSSVSNLQTARNNISCLSSNNWIIFFGGETNSNLSDAVDFYNTSFKRTTATLPYLIRNSSNTVLGNYGIFCGGEQSSSVYASSIIEIYDLSQTSLVRTSKKLSQCRSKAGCASISNKYALIGGGTTNTSNSANGLLNSVEVLDSNLTATTPLTLSTAKRVGAVSVENAAIFYGGYDGSSASLSVEAFDSNLVKRSLSNLTSQSNSYNAGDSTSFKDLALIGCADRLIDVYDSTLAKTSTVSLVNVNYCEPICATNDYAFVGFNGTNYNIDVFTYATI